ncbi:Dipeptidyl peptidase 4 [Acromyrmex echinatior]|uniref:Dipeptidyl peptidase 4 n=1 Tax=Acromyrmex echinatior TaxID=103372 RepID=F4W7S7_ACREC|nr:Dipeptidyl peptidase 4 [Acromyrmex echinatior]
MLEIILPDPKKSIWREDVKFMKATDCSVSVKKKYLYYMATSERESAVQHLYRVSLDPGYKSTCLTCNIVRESDGSRCLYNSAKFSIDNSHYVLTCAGPGVPDIAIYNKIRDSDIFDNVCIKNMMLTMINGEIVVVILIIYGFLREAISTLPLYFEVHEVTFQKNMIKLGKSCAPRQGRLDESFITFDNQIPLLTFHNDRRVGTPT